MGGRSKSPAILAFTHVQFRVEPGKNRLAVLHPTGARGGKPAHVLVSFEEYLRPTNRRQGDLIDDLGMPEGVEDAVLEVPPMKDRARPADFD